MLRSVKAMGKTRRLARPPGGSLSDPGAVATAGTPEGAARPQQPADPATSPRAATDSAGPETPSGHGDKTAVPMAKDATTAWPPPEPTGPLRTPVAAGRSVGRYRVCFELATGGMATVYLARMSGSAGFEKFVALKCIHPHLARDSRFVDMFLDEARIAARIDHPNVCTIFDFGQAEDSHFLAMEYLIGEPLSNVLSTAVAKGDTLSHEGYRRICARIIVDACEGLEAVHEVRDAQGQPLHVVHRDISPMNLFLTYDGNVKVVDFGIAQAKHRLHRTATGELKGSVAYIAPEQIRAADVDRRADIWSLGVVLWELLTGHRLFARPTTVKTLYAVLNEAPPRPSSVRPDIPAAYDLVTTTALSRDPGQRFGSARAFGEALAAAAQEDGGVASRAELAAFLEALFPRGRARKLELCSLAAELPQARREPSSGRLFGLAAIVALAVVAGLVGLTAGVFSAGDADDHGASARAGAASAGAADVSASPAATAEPGGVADPNLPAHGTDPVAALAGIRTAPDSALAGDTPTAGGTPEQGGTPPTADVGAQRPSSAPARRGSHRPRPTSTAGAAAEGRLNVVTPDGWAVVMLGHRRLGQTPLQTSLPAGDHVLDVLPEGRPPARRVRVHVDARVPGRVVVRLHQ